MSSSSERRFYWQGTCFHNYEVPRWVQKSRQVSNDARPIYIEPRRATQVAVNARFSLIAVGTLRYVSFEQSIRDAYTEVNSGAIEFTTFPTQGNLPKPRIIEVPNPYNRPRGEVLTLHWSSDGYVLAVGWQHGWAIISIGGRCLASNFDVDDTVDNDK